MDSPQELAQDFRTGRTDPPAGVPPTHLLDLLPVAVFTIDRAGLITGYNARAAELWGRKPPCGDARQRFCGSSRLFLADGTPVPHDQCPMARILEDGRPVRDFEVVMERPDGSRIIALANIVALRDASGAVVGAMNCFDDITGRKRVEARSRAGHDASHLASIVESSDDAIVSKSLDGIIASWNRGAERLFGYTADEVIGKPITILIPEDRQDEEPRILERIRRGERVDHYETIRRRKDGTLFDVSLTVSPVKNAVGEIIGASKIARDITAQKQAQERLKLLARELDHRAKNILATVQALTRMTRAETIPAYVEILLGRLRALAHAHTLLAKSRWTGVDLRRLIEEELDPYGTDGDGHLSISGPVIEVSPDAGQGLAMALHELATNAAKYGAFSVPGGSVAVSWWIDGARLVLHWVEKGGPPVREPGRRGFGSGLIEAAVTGQLDGDVTFDWRPTGLACELSISTEKLKAP